MNLQRSLALFAALLFGASAARAQFDSAAVLGSVRDAKGGAISGAAVTLKNLDTGIVAQATTDAAGDYIFPTVRIGAYSVTAEMAGFSRAIVERVNITVNARQRVDLMLQVGAVTEVVNVTAEAPLLESESSSKGQVITQKQIVNLPILGRSYSNLALLVPGVRQSQVGNQGDIAFRREGSYNVNGLRSVFNNFLLDGVDNNFYGTTNQGFSNQAIQPSPDSVAEFRMVVNAYSAEYGRSGGAVMNVSSRSGGNEFHGSLWNFLQNTRLNAYGFFKPTVNNQVLPKPQVNRNQFGGTFGGPLVKDRTFFFADYEGSRWIQSPFQFVNLPSLDHRRGVLPTDVRVPIAFTDDQGRSIAAGTVIPAGQPIPMTRFARRVLNELPQPNSPGGGALGIANNYSGYARNQLNEDKGAVKIDHQLKPSVATFFRYTQRRQDIFQPGVVTGFSGGNSIGNLNVFNQNGTAGATWTKSATEVLEYRFAVTRLGMDRLPALVGTPSMQDLFGITGLPTGERVRGGITPQDITGLGFRIGRQSTNPQAQFPTTINSRLNLSKIAGRHNLKMGYEWLYMRILVDDTNPLYGIDGFGGTFSRPTGGTANNYFYNIADFYFGARSSYQLATQVAVPIRQQGHWFYLQDDWKATDKLTLNLGLRYELTTPFYEAEGRQANFDPATNRLVQATNGSIEERAQREIRYGLFSPRVGAAYQLNKRLVLRGGYGLGYNYWNRMASAEILGTNAPFVTRFSRQNSAALLNTPCAGNNFDGCFRTREMGYPVNPPSNVILYTPTDLPWGQIHNWHFTMQYSLTKDTLLDVAYVGNRGTDLPLLGDFNQARPITQEEVSRGLTTLGTLQARRPYQGFGNITAVVTGGFSNYNALQVKFERRGRDLLLLNAFTYSKAIDNGGQVLETTNGGSPNPQDIRNVANDRGPSSFDQRFNNTTSVTYSLPFGKGKRFGSGMPGAVDAFLGGWEASSIITLTGGQPLNIRYPDFDGRLSDGQPDFLGNVALRPNLIDGSQGAKAPDASRTFTNYFNRANLAIPAAIAPFGNLGRNVVYGFPLYQVDFTMSKSFALPFINETSRLAFRAEFFNFFNRTNFGAPVVDLTSANFGRVTSTFDPRLIQLALKLNF
ncbi:MAG TPA: TonB-dependent receptor [Solibacterales bacterium]|nr:TonB-dependent receptor [Bryobacterales bacterium]